MKKRRGVTTDHVGAESAERMIPSLDSLKDPSHILGDNRTLKGYEKRKRTFNRTFMLSTKGPFLLRYAAEKSPDRGRGSGKSFNKTRASLQRKEDQSQGP